MEDFWKVIVAEVFPFYEKNLRANFFAGFLTIGTFLFAVKTFIVVKIKEDVFDTDFYKKRVEGHRSLNRKKKIVYYGPLKRLMAVIFYAEIISLITACYQLTFGFIKSPWAAMVGIVMSILSMGLLLVAICLVKGNLNVWLEESEKIHDP